jgi:ribonuclease HI
MAKAPKYYVVWKGRQAGIFGTWAECQRQVVGFSGARFKSFPTRAEAERAYREGAAASVSTGAKSSTDRKASLGKTSPRESSQIVRDSVSVDAACAGNPGILEYRGVDNATGAELFREGPFAEGTNNIGEFLAIVHALQMLAAEGSERLIYSDSETAIGWVAAKRVRTTLKESEVNRILFKRLADALKWLETNEYPNPILKWRTEAWGENTADFGRK